MESSYLSLYQSKDFLDHGYAATESGACERLSRDCCRIAFLSLFVQNNPYFCVAKTTILPLGNSPLKPNKVALGHLRKKAVYCLAEHYSFLTVSFSGKPAFRRKIPSFLCLKHGVQASEIRLVASEKALFLSYRISSWQLLSLSLVGRLVRSLARLSTRS